MIAQILNGSQSTLAFRNKLAVRKLIFQKVGICIYKTECVCLCRDDVIRKNYAIKKI